MQLSLNYVIFFNVNTFSHPIFAGPVYRRNCHKQSYPLFSQIFCGSCSSHFIALPHYGLLHSVRVCDSCHLQHATCLTPADIQAGWAWFPPMICIVGVTTVYVKEWKARIQQRFTSSSFLFQLLWGSYLKDIFPHFLPSSPQPVG